MHVSHILAKFRLPTRMSTLPKMMGAYIHDHFSLNKQCSELRRRSSMCNIAAVYLNSIFVASRYDCDKVLQLLILSISFSVYFSVSVGVLYMSCNIVCMCHVHMVCWFLCASEIGLTLFPSLFLVCLPRNPA